MEKKGDKNENVKNPICEPAKTRNFGTRHGKKNLYPIHTSKICFVKLVFTE